MTVSFSNYNFNSFEIKRIIFLVKIGLGEINSFICCTSFSFIFNFALTSLQRV